MTIITVVDDNGRLLRRIRRDRRGREFTLIDNRRKHWRRHRGRRIGDFGFVVDLPAPIINIPHKEYHVDAGYASEDDIYEALSAPPVDDIEPEYTLDEIRYSPSVRDRFRKVSLSTINFEFGSWELSEDQIDRLEVIGRAIRRILRRSPDEVFYISGHTDAVGSEEDNLSLSDRRAETVARVLSDEFDIPPENLVTQGYGEQSLLVETQGPERRNRRVEFQRITEALARNNKEKRNDEY
jgi:outer membrane protein OmpA-like peptidoglycan-associated protein